MCRSCNRVFPTFEYVHKYFYRHDGTLYRQALPRSAFNTETSYIQYKKRENKPVTVYGENQMTYIVGYGQLPIGAIKCIMDGIDPREWYHRTDKSVIENNPRQSKFVSNKILPPIPAIIYRNGFLQQTHKVNEHDWTKISTARRL